VADIGSNTYVESIVISSIIFVLHTWCHSDIIEGEFCDARVEFAEEGQWLLIEVNNSYFIGELLRIPVQFHQQHPR
jgi:hypothetical protein